MIPNEHRAKGAGPQLGARVDGDAGPFGVRGQEPEDDGQEGYPSTGTPDGDQEPGGLDPIAAVNTRVEQQIAAARARRERRDRQRRALEDARVHGVAARHRAKLARDDSQLPDDAA